MLHGRVNKLSNFLIFFRYGQIFRPKVRVWATVYELPIKILYSIWSFYVKTAVFGPIYIILWLLTGIKAFFTIWENVKNKHFKKKNTPIQKNAKMSVFYDKNCYITTLITSSCSTSSKNCSIDSELLSFPSRLITCLD